MQVLNEKVETEIVNAKTGASEPGTAGFVWFISIFAVYMLVQMVFFPNQGIAPS